MLLETGYWLCTLSFPMAPFFVGFNFFSSIFQILPIPHGTTVLCGVLDSLRGLSP